MTAANRSSSEWFPPEMGGDDERQCVAATHGDEIFDESVYYDGTNVRTFVAAVVFNRADEYIIRTRWPRLPIIEPSERIVCNQTMVLNPTVAQRGSNVYTMDATNKPIGWMAPVNPIKVVDAHHRVRPLLLGPHDAASETAYDVSPDLLGLEQAILIKYYAIHHANVAITAHLREMIKPYLDGFRHWFYEPGDRGHTMNGAYNLLYQGQIVDPILDWASEPVSL